MSSLRIESESRDETRSPNREGLNRWVRQLIGAHFGVIEDLARVPCEPDDVPLAVYAGRLARTSAIQGIDAPRAVSGAALHPDDALAACIGEAVERYSAALIAPGSIVPARAEELSDDVITPECFALFSARQHLAPSRRFPFRRWRSSDRIGWKSARCLSSGILVWVPAVFVHQPYQSIEGESLIAPSLSTGLAASTNQVQAIVAGLCEVIERDAVSLAWLGRLSPPRIEFEIDGLDGELAKIISHLDERGFRWAAFDLTTDLEVPVAAALIEGNSCVGSVVSFGSACHPHPTRAALKALIEAAHGRMYVKSLCRAEPGWNVGRNLRRVQSFADHARFYTCHPQRRRSLGPWWSTRSGRRWACSARSADSDEVLLNRLIDRVTARGLRACAVDLTPPDIASLGLCVVRVLVPGLQPLHGCYGWPHLGGPRLRELRSVFGPEARQPWSWNRAPHPCP